MANHPKRPRFLQSVLRLAVCILGLAVWIGSHGHIRAQETGTEQFLGVAIDGKRQAYVVTRDVNVRARPETGSQRLGGLKEGEKVMARGRYQGWVAIERDGEPYGFAYFKYLLPFIDGKLSEPVVGTARFDAGECSYEITFDGKTRPEGEVFEFSDYTVDLVCAVGTNELAFELLAFMTEGPYARGKDSVHQIGIDLLVIAKDFDNVLSSILLYDHAKSEVAFDQITLGEYAGRPSPTVRPAEDVATALDAAVRITLDAWNDKVWEVLADALG